MSIFTLQKKNAVSNSLLSIAAVVFLMVSTINAQSTNATKSTANAEQQTLIQDRFDQFYEERAGFQEETPELIIPIQVHIIRRNDQTGGVNFTQIREEFHRYIIPQFEKAKLRFSFCNTPNYIDNSNFFILEEEKARLLSSSNNVTNAVNIYYAQSTDKGCGWTYIPEPHRKEEYPNDFIVIDIDCATDNNTTIHELGHFFGLYDTDEEVFGEACPDESNCATAGDKLCDTPADPGLTQETVDDDCEYIGDAMECDEDFNPDPTNFMSNAPKTCRTNFSDDQLAFMHHVANEERAYLKGSSCELASLLYVDYSVDDDNRTSRGNSDGQAEPGEKIELKIRLRNHSNEKMTSISGTLSTTDPSIISIPDNREGWPDMEAGSTAMCHADFDFEIAADASGAEIIFQLLIEADQGSWTETFSLPIQSTPNLTSCGDPENKMVLNGDILEITSKVSNTGGAVGRSRIGYYLSEDENITTADHFLGSNFVPALAKNTTAIKMLNVDLSDLELPANTYYVGFLIDENQEVLEGNELDNSCYFDSPTITLPLSNSQANLTSCDDPQNEIDLDEENLSLVIGVNNTGTAEANNVVIGIYFSADEEITRDDKLVAEQTITKLSADGSTSRAFNIDLNTLNMADGSYHIGYIIDHNNQVPESDESDNSCRFTELQLDFPLVEELPNLSACNNSGNRLTRNGDVINLKVKVDNSGTGKSSGAHIGYYFSTDQSITTADYLIGTDFVSTLSPGAVSLETASFDLTQLNLPRGTYYVGYFLDFRGILDESNETDNACLFNTNTITISKSAGEPNLTACNSNANVERNGNLLDISVKIENQGTGAAEATYIGYYLSSNTIITTSDYRIGEARIDPILAGSSITKTVTLDLSKFNLPTGTYYLGYFVDYKKNLKESQESDNECYWKTPTISFPLSSSGQANLTACNSNKNLTINGSQLDLSIKVENTGTAASADSKVGYYLSTNQTITTGDYFIGEDIVSSLEPGASSTETFSIDVNNLNIPDNKYYVGFIVDYRKAVSETDENDNDCHWSSPRVTIESTNSQQPNLAACSSDDRLDVNGSIIDLSIKVQNTGNAIANSSTVGYYLSTNQTITTGDYLIGEDVVNSLSPGATGIESFNIDSRNLNLPAGTYYVGYILDYKNVVSESIEEDNVCFWRSPRVEINNTPQLPNFIACPRDGASLSINGNMVDIQVVIENIGEAPATKPSQLNYYFSTDQNITTNDYLVGSDALDLLEVGESNTLNIRVNLTDLNIPDGIYYVGYIADANNEIIESNENDNSCYWSDPTVEIKKTPDLPNLTACNNMETRMEIDGKFLKAIVDIKNKGNARAEANELRLVFSVNNTISTSDFRILTATVPALEAGDGIVITFTYDLTQWIGQGKYYVGVVLDANKEITESNEDDNACLLGNGPLNFPINPLPNLTACNASGTKLQRLNDNTEFRLSIEVENIGNDLSENASIKIYLSRDKIITSSDILLSDMAIGSLAPGSSQTVTYSSNLDPLGLSPGTYYVGFIIDMNAEETNKDDNVCVFGDLPMDVKIKLPNLTACNRPRTFMRLNGSILTLTVEVENDGDATAPKSEITLYLSDNNTITEGDYALKTWNVSALSPGQTIIYTFNFDLDILVGEGDFYVGFYLDPKNNIIESNEFDNPCLVGTQPITLPIVKPKLPNLTSCGTPQSKVSVTPDNKLNISVQVVNSGTAQAKASTVGLYLSENTVITTSDFFIMPIGIDALNPNFSVTKTINQIDLRGRGIPAGTYYVGYILDKDKVVQESEENDNVCLYPNFVINLNGSLVTRKEEKEQLAKSAPNYQEEKIIPSNGEAKHTVVAPIDLSLAPNPARDHVRFNWNLAQEQIVSLEVKDLQGRRVAQLIDNESRNSGHHQFDFDSSALHPGMYVVILSSPESRTIQKLIIAE